MAAITLAVGHLLITFVRPMWLKLIVAAAFAAPAATTGFDATHGIVKHLMPSEAWQVTFSVIHAVPVGMTAFGRVAGMGGGRQSGVRPRSCTGLIFIIAVRRI
ncbi:hypothetical protein [Mesorhizobium sp. WSM3859]|uniref:hypothetical protein n=1 Tax=Mesorhizobium sp. WSM3859 TaxID=2029402 RepID=UPI0026C5326E